MSFEQLQSQADSNTERLDALKKIPDLPVNTNPPETGFTVLYNPITGQDERVPYASLPAGQDGQDGSGSQNRVITLADPTDLAELNAITGMAEGDITVVTNYLNDKVTFIYDGTSWTRVKAQEFSAVVRYNETTEEYEFIDDSAHTPLGTLGITTDPTTNFQFSIQYPTATTIGAVVAGVDEEFARRGMFIGASVGNGESFFKVVKQGFNIRLGGTAGGVVVANETSTLLKADSFTITHDAGAGETTISHPTIPCQIDSRALAYDTGNVLRPFVKSFTPTSAVITWWKRSDNTQQLALTTTMKACYQQLGTYQMPNNVVSDSGNFWIKGTFYTV